MSKRRKIVVAHGHLGGDFLAHGLAPERCGERAADRRQLLGAAAHLAHVALMVDDHDVASDANLVAVRLVIVERDRGHEARLARIGYIDDRGPETIRIGNVSDKGMGAADRDLTASGEIEMTQAADVAGEASGRSIVFMWDPLTCATSCRHPRA